MAHLYPNNFADLEHYSTDQSDASLPGGVAAALHFAISDNNSNNLETYFMNVAELTSGLVEGTPSGRLVYMKSDGQLGLAISEAANPEKARVIGLTQEVAPVVGQPIRIVTWGRARFYHGGDLLSGAPPYKIYVPDENGTGHEAGVPTADNDSGLCCGIVLSPGDFVRVWPCVQ